MAKLLGYDNRKNKPSIKIIIVDIESITKYCLFIKLIYKNYMF
tara:strand:- start:327 stop:455 length:129 start_codon:yes stop_codon:yes gene_type:complete